MLATTKRKRGQKRTKHDVRRGVAEMLKNSMGGRESHALEWPSNLRVVIPETISYREARSMVLANLCPVCEAYLTVSNHCPKCGTSWSLDELEAAFPKS